MLFGKIQTKNIMIQMALLCLKVAPIQEIHLTIQ